MSFTIHDTLLAYQEDEESVCQSYMGSRRELARNSAEENEIIEALVCFGRDARIIPPKSNAQVSEYVLKDASSLR